MPPSPLLTKHIKSDKRTLILLQRCLAPRQLKQVHSRLVVSGAIADSYAAGKLVSLFSFTDLHHTALILRHLPRPSAFLWNSMIRAYLDRCQPAAALALYDRMLASGRLPNNYTFSFLLRACLDLSALLDGLKIHAQIVRLGWESYDFVHNGLIHMYASCGAIDCARRLFDTSSYRDVITWTAMTHGYCKARKINVARELFHRMPERNAVAWSSMITTYSQIGMFKEALEFFNEMQLSGIEPNHAGVVGALSACGFLGAIDQGRWIHAFVERKGMELDRILGTALIDMYAKCGCIEISWQVFNEMPEKDVFAYTSMISGLSNHGHSEWAIDLFGRMQEEGVRPNEVTFICLLSACARMGLVDRGRELFDSMKGVYGINPGVEHYGCLVDLLGRSGLLEEAKRLVREMPMKPDSYVLGAFLNACRMHGELEMGKETMESLTDLGFDYSGVHVLLSNMYASVSMWEDVVKVREGMEEKKVRKEPGCSMIEVDGLACEFVAGDRSHWLIDEIKGMDKQLKTFACDIHTIESGPSIQKRRLDLTFSSKILVNSFV